MSSPAAESVRARRRRRGLAKAPSDPGEAEELAAILRDVRVLARHGSFPVATRRFGELRLEDGRHQALEREVLDPLEAELEPEERAALWQLMASRARLLRLEAACAAALERCACAEYEAAADALEGELGAHAAMERLLTRRLQELPVRRAERRAIATTER